MDRERELISRESALAAHEAAQNVAISHLESIIRDVAFLNTIKS